MCSCDQCRWLHWLHTTWTLVAAPVPFSKKHKRYRPAKSSQSTDQYSKRRVAYVCLTLLKTRVKTKKKLCLFSLFLKDWFHKLAIIDVQSGPTKLFWTNVSACIKYKHGEEVSNMQHDSSGVHDSAKSPLLDYRLVQERVIRSLSHLSIFSNTWCSARVSELNLSINPTCIYIMAFCTLTFSWDYPHAQTSF